MKISILICRLPKRYEMFHKLNQKLFDQYFGICDGEIEVIWNGEDWTIGAKRNELIERAKGEYSCFIDDDDDISDNYIEWLLKAAESGCDCASLKGVITTDGENRYVFEHSVKYKEYKTINIVCPDSELVKYERYPNHLNLIKTSIAKQFKFPEINHGEDTDWATQIRDSGLLKTQFEIPEVIYYYKYISKK